jgi:hypothetical protein
MARMWHGASASAPFEEPAAGTSALVPLSEAETVKLLGGAS